MDEIDRLRLENEEYRKNLETLVTARTEQLRQALSRNSELLECLKALQSIDSLEQMRAAVQAAIKKFESPAAQAAQPDDQLKKTGIPAVDKLISTIDTEEKALARSEALDAAIEKFNAGDPLPPVNASDLRQLWHAHRCMRADMGPPKPGTAVGLAVVAGYGFEAASPTPEQLMPTLWRYQLLSALVERGVLNNYVCGDEPDERAFRAAATMPFSKDDFFGAIMPDMLTQMPPDDVAKLTEDVQAGYDINRPGIDRKFLEWLRNNC